jgi:hypothetical protein
MFGLMQFINSPSPLISFASASTTCACVGILLYWWRKTGGAAWSMRELLPQGRAFVAITVLLAVYYLFWSWAIRREALPPVWPAQVSIWVIYAGLILLLTLCVRKMESATSSGLGTIARRTFQFSWRAFFQLSLLAAVVATLAKVFLAPFGGVQILLFFSFYVLAGILLLLGTTIHAFRRPSLPPPNSDSPPQP